jgi:hypothetical protein
MRSFAATAAGAYNGGWTSGEGSPVKLSARLILLEANRATWRAARDRRRRLEHEMSLVVTPTERLDLLATLDRYPDAVTWDLRELLSRSATRNRVQSWPAMRP